MTSSTPTTTPNPVSPGGVSRRTMSSDECRSWLSSHCEGRLGYSSGRGHRNVVVAYALDGDAIIVRVPEFNEITQYVPGRQVTLDVTDRAGAHWIEQVVVTGPAAVGAHVEASVLDRLPDERWPDDLSKAVVTVSLEKVDGCVFDGGNDAA